MNRAPGSQSPATRSRAVSFPCVCCLSIFSWPPPRRRRCSSVRSSALNSRSRLVTGASGFLMRLLLREPALDVIDQLGGGRSRSEQSAGAHRLEGLDVFFGEDAA